MTYDRGKRSWIMEIRILGRSAELGPEASVKPLLTSGNTGNDNIGERAQANRK